jgi:hypothetical protein
MLSSHRPSKIVQYVHRTRHSLTGLYNTLAHVAHSRVHAQAMADYLLEKNPATGTKIWVDVEGKELKIADL